jgi:hypothetical protein
MDTTDLLGLVSIDMANGEINTTRANEGFLENTLRHVYFFDHPIEFAIMNRDKKWYMEMKELVDYAKAHPDLARSESSFDAIGKLTSLYSDLSGGIHGRKVSDLEMRVALAHVTFDQAAAEREAALLEKAAEVCNFILVIFHRAQLPRFTTDDRREILQSMSKRARRIVGDFQ